GKSRLEWAAGASGAFFDPTHSINQPLPRFHHEGPVLPEVGEESSPRLQGGPPPRQDLRDLQDQPALQGPPALSFRAGRPGKAAETRPFSWATPGGSGGSRGLRGSGGSRDCDRLRGFRRSHGATPPYNRLTIHEDLAMRLQIIALLALCAAAGTAFAAGPA